MLRRRVDAHGAVAVPGEASVDLPSGKVRLTYQESYEADSGPTGDSLDFRIPPGLTISVVSPTGESLAIKGPGIGGMGSRMSRGKGWTRAVIGTVRVTTAGPHAVRAAGEVPGTIEPQVLIG
jgi:hypothetical protein